MTLSVTLPAEIAAGATLEGIVRDPDRPAPDWSMALLLASDAASITIAGQPYEGADHRFLAAAADTAGWAAAAYVWTVRATRASDGFVADIDAGVLVVAPDPSAPASPRAARIAALQKQIAAIDVATGKIASSGISAYTLRNRSISYYSPAELFAIRKKLATQLWAARHPGRSFTGVSVLP